MQKFVILVFTVMLFAACNSSVKNNQSSDTNDAGSIVLHKVDVEEVIQTSTYTYLLVTEKGEKYWTAISKDDIKTGEELFYFSANVTTMENFHSTELDRDFDRILFISKISKENGAGGALVDPHAAMGMGSQSETAHTGRKQAEPGADIQVKKAEGGMTIAELYANPKSFSGKKVKISGVVVKVNNQIMGKNWVHIQDGTKYNDEYDLTFTTQDLVNLNDVVVIEGEVGIDKDFTSGYFYPVIVENTKVLN
ncbi:MAG: GW dipeptide domain-containing protein [Prolixibacteraceae bacterium]